MHHQIQPARRTVAVIGLAVALAGGLIAGLGHWLDDRATAFAQRAVRTTGFVVDRSRRYPSYFYTDRAGGKHHGSAGYFIGDSLPDRGPVAVLYDPDDPARSCIDTPLQRRGGPVIVCVFGLVVLAFGIRIGYVAVRPPSNKRP